MPPAIETTRLFIHLTDIGHTYAAKLLELREVLEGWLAYTPQTFPHYTRHTIAHSDELIRQASSLLFDEEGQPTVALSAVELYIIGASAYLHDAGMVSSDEEKRRILSSADWGDWVGASAPGAKRMAAIEALRANTDVPDPAVRNFLADLQLRRLLAEFIRRHHASRGGRLAIRQEAAFGRFAFQNAMLRDTIADVCIAHGLSRKELDDTYRFPFRRDILGEKVNVRFAAIILRLADLLDMSEERACPLLLNAASPLPAESAAHWTQYRRITHRMTSPERLEIRAECQTQHEHRILRDWLQWLSDECESARALMAGSPRHGSWRPPRAELQRNEGSLQVLPAAGATYFESDWTFELDAEAVIERLVKDVYDDPLAFVRELLQNALDSTRCSLYREIEPQGATPSTPTDVPESLRRKYPVRVALTTSERTNPLSGEVETRHVVTISDMGMGMTAEVIERYLLQIGRSFYTTPAFRRQYSFTPTSRFGIGFLSVLAVSDEVTVETKALGSPGIRLVLTGPSDYLLTDHIDKPDIGTDVHVVLRNHLSPEELTERVKWWCRRVEFPIHVEEFGDQTSVERESADDFIYSEADVSEEGAQLAVKAFPVSSPGIEGELYVFAYTDSQGDESWTRWHWASYAYTRNHPLAVGPRLPANVVCINGIAVGNPRSENHYQRAFAARVDIRKPISTSLNRLEVRSGGTITEIREEWQRLLTLHMESKSGIDWKYRNALAELWSFPEYWNSVPGMVPVVQGLKTTEVGVEDVRIKPVLKIHFENHPLQETTLDSDARSIRNTDFVRLEEHVAANLLEGRELYEIEEEDDRLISATWKEGPHGHLIKGRPGAHAYTVYALPLHGAVRVGYLMDMNRSRYVMVLNCNQPLAKWALRVSDAAQKGDPHLRGDEASKILGLIHRALLYKMDHPTLETFLDNWRKAPYPAALQPPSEMPPTRIAFAKGLAI